MCTRSRYACMHADRLAAPSLRLAQLFTGAYACPVHHERTWACDVAVPNLLPSCMGAQATRGMGTRHSTGVASRFHVLLMPRTKYLDTLRVYMIALLCIDLHVDGCRHLLLGMRLTHILERMLVVRGENTKRLANTRLTWSCGVRSTLNSCNAPLRTEVANT
jgi:hypothetical protein